MLAEINYRLVNLEVVNATTGNLSLDYIPRSSKMLLSLSVAAWVILGHYIIIIVSAN